MLWTTPIGGVSGLAGAGADGSHDVDFAAWGAVLGLDYRMDAALRFGIAAGYTRVSFRPRAFRAPGPTTLSSRDTFATRQARLTSKAPSATASTPCR